MTTILETERLLLCQLSIDDAPFILELLNEPSYLRFIGDKGVRTLADAQAYLLNGPLDSYQRHGFGLYLTRLKASGMPLGLCGLIRRPGLEHVDIGYAFLPRFWSKGYASEAATAVLDYGLRTLRLERIVAITAQDNQASIKLLEKIGLRFEKMIRLPGDSEEIKLFAIENSARPKGSVETHP